jgi:hypothetical protein
LELEPSEPICGVLYSEGGAPRPFTGWLELISRIEEIRERPRDDERGRDDADS